MATANSAMDRRYAMMRQQVQDQENEQRQQEIEGMRRRFASMGALGSGAALKSEQKAQQAGAKRLQSAFGQLDIARLGEEQQLEEAEKQRSFMRGEREASQLFGAGEAEKQRGWGSTEAEKQRFWGSEEAGKQRTFQTGERIAGQEFLGGENALQRAFLKGEREASQTFATGERVAGQEFQKGIVDKQLAQQFDLAIRQMGVQRAIFQQEYDLNKEIAAFNMYGTVGPTAGKEYQSKDAKRKEMQKRYGAGYNSPFNADKIQAEWDNWLAQNGY